VLAFGAAALFARLRSPLPLAAYEDDAFYYFQIARNIATGHGSSFDGTHLTNGYHPLWMLVCVIAAWLGKGRTFFVLLQCVAFLSMATSYFAARSLFRLVCRQSEVVEIASAAVALQCLLLIHGGMEITLTLPLALSLCVFRLRPTFRWTPGNAAAYGALAALVVLSRLDSLLWIGMLLCAELALAWDKKVRPHAMLLALASAALPIALYVFTNHHWFHAWMPVSASAKEFRLHRGFSLAGIRHSMYLLDHAYGVMVVAIASMLRTDNSSPPAEVRAVALTLLLFPAVQLATLCFLSDWHIWPWYLYSFVLAMIGALLWLMAAAPQRGPESTTRPSLALLVTCGAVLPMGLAYSIYAAIGTEQPLWAEFAGDMQGFASTHAGLYAMGDCAGASSFVLQQPLIQTEGLVMDADFLQNIRQEKDLQSVLQNYGVRYYATFRATPENKCFRVEEPSIAGPDSARMHGLLCQTPVATYPAGGATLRIFAIPPRDGR
jgi:hypothetical protein